MALETQQQVEALADRLTACADSVHTRLINAIKNKEIDRETAQSIFQEEVILRQRANSLYMDAANCVVRDLSMPQNELIDIIDTAKEKLTTIIKTASFIDLLADLIVMAAAAYAGKPASIIAALKEVKSDIEAISDT